MVDEDVDVVEALLFRHSDKISILAASDNDGRWANEHKRGMRRTGEDDILI